YFLGPSSNLPSPRSLTPASDEPSSLEWRVRSYLAANCAQCHQPGGSGLGDWNRSVVNSTSKAGMIDGALRNDGGTTNAHVIAPGSMPNSMLLSRISRRVVGQMPPLATSLLDTQAMQ